MTKPVPCRPPWWRIPRAALVPIFVLGMFFVLLIMSAYYLIDGGAP